MIKKLEIGFLTMFGIGYSRFAPGTMASITTCLIYIFCFAFNVDVKFLIFLNFIFFFLSIYLIDKNSKKFETDDAKEIVIDEFIGQSIPSLTVYGIFTEVYIGQFFFFSLIAFIFFRFFDILKPYPINIVDKKIKNGFGVLFDDILAGIFSSILILLILFFISNV